MKQTAQADRDNAGEEPVVGSPAVPGALASPATVLVLRTCDADLRSYGGFQWPDEGEVAAPDWSDEPVCGRGLHGLLWGEGDGGLLNWNETARWLVVEVAVGDYVSIDGKVKFPRGTVVFCGDRLDATQYLSEHGGAGRAIVGGTATAGYRGTATAGYGGTATAGYGGTATAGDRGTATAGYGGTATAGDRGTVQVRWWDDKAERYRTATGDTGEDGIEPNVAYHVLNGRLVAVPVPTEATA